MFPSEIDKSIVSKPRHPASSSQSGSLSSSEAIKITTLEISPPQSQHSTSLAADNPTFKTKVGGPLSRIREENEDKLEESDYVIRHIESGQKYQSKEKPAPNSPTFGRINKKEEAVQPVIIHNPNPQVPNIVYPPPKQQPRPVSLKQLQLDYPRRIDNYKILQKVIESEALSLPESQKLITNYRFYAKDRNLTNLFQQTLAQDGTLGLDCVKKSPFRKELSALFSAIVEKASSQLKINPFASFDLLQSYLYLRTNQSIFTNPKVIDKLKDADVLYLMSGNNFGIRTETSFVQRIVDALEVILEQQLKYLPLIFSHASQSNLRLFCSEYQANKCFRNLWNSLVYYSHTSHAENHQRIDSIGSIMTMVLSTLRLVLPQKFICEIVQAIDDCMRNRRIGDSIGISFITQLLELDAVNLALKGIKNTSNMNIFNTPDQLVKDCVLRLSSPQLFPLKVILPSIDSLLMKVQARGKEDDLRLELLETKEHWVKCRGWFDWIEIWIGQIKRTQRYTLEELITALECLRSCMSFEHQMYWMNQYSPRFQNTKWLLAESVKCNLLSHTFAILQESIGNIPTHRTDQAFDLSMSILGADSLTTVMKQGLDTLPKEESSERSCVSFISKLLTLSSEISTKIEREVFRYEGESGVLVLYFMQILAKSKESEIRIKVIKVFNSLFEYSPRVFVAQIHEFDREMLKCELDFIFNIQDLKNNKELFEGLCQHLNLLILSPYSSILGQDSSWINSFREFKPWKIRTSQSIKCIKTLLESFGSGPEDSYWKQSLVKVDINRIFEPITIHKAKSKSNPGVINKVLDNFLAQPQSETTIADLRVLAETLCLVETGITLIEKMMAAQTDIQPDIPPILSTIMETFVYNSTNTDKVTPSIWSQPQKSINPHLIFLQFFSLSQDKIQHILSITNTNIARTSINILTKIMKINSIIPSSNPEKSNTLLKLLQSPSNQPSRKDALIQHISMKLQAKYLLESIVVLLIELIELERALFNDILGNLKKELANIFAWIFRSKNFQLKLKTQILLLKMAETNSKQIHQLMLSLFSSSTFIVSLTKQKDMSTQFNTRSYSDQMIKAIENPSLRHTRYFHQLLLRYTLISNSSLLFLKIIKDYNVSVPEANRQSFFQLFSLENLMILSKKEIEFDQKLLVQEGKLFKFVPINVVDQTNRFILGYRQRLDAFESVIEVIRRSKTSACSNLFKLFMAVINPARVLPISKEIFESEMSTQQITNIFIDLIPSIREGNNPYFPDSFFMIGTVIRILNKSSFQLIKELLKDTQWLQLSTQASNKPILFLIQSCVNVGFKSKQLSNAINVLLKQPKEGITQQHIALAFSSQHSICDQIISYLPYLTQQTRTFSLCCEYLYRQYHRQQINSGAESQDISHTVMSCFCGIVSKFKNSIQELQFYTKGKRNKDHVVWCWLLAISKTIITPNQCQGQEQFYKIVMVRLNSLMSFFQEMDVDAITWAFKEELQLILEYYFYVTAIVRSPTIRSHQVIFKLWIQFTSITMDLRADPATNYQLQMDDIWKVQKTAGLLSSQSTMSQLGSLNSQKKSSNPVFQKLCSVQKPYLTPLELLNEISTHKILYRLLEFLEKNYSEFSLQSQQTRQQFTSCFLNVLKRTLLFYKDSEQYFLLEEQFKTLNQMLFSPECEAETYRLNTLKELLRPQPLSKLLFRIIVLCVRINSLHLQYLNQLLEENRVAIMDEIVPYFNQIETIGKRMDQMKCFESSEIKLRDNLQSSKVYASIYQLRKPQVKRETRQVQDIRQVRKVEGKRQLANE